VQLPSASHSAWHAPASSVVPGHTMVALLQCVICTLFVAASVSQLGAVTLCGRQATRSGTPPDTTGRSPAAAWMLRKACADVSSTGAAR